MRAVARTPTARAVHTRETLDVRGGAMRLAVVADTHGRPHPALDERLRELAPAHILHAGDIGDLAVLDALARHAPVTAVRGNIDGHVRPDLVTIDVEDSEGGGLLRVLLMHIAVNGPKLRADAARAAREVDASVVVCGHSHVPLVASDRGRTIFNPGSVGPRRFQLPVVLGVMDVRTTGVSLRHVDCETGLVWAPAARRSG